MVEEKGKGDIRFGSRISIVDLNPKDVKAVENIANLALDTAKEFTEQVGFSKRFDLDQDRLELFEYYFAHYIVLKNVYETHYLSRFSIINGLGFEKEDMLNDKAAEVLMIAAKSKAEDILLSEKEWTKNVLGELIQEKPEIKNVFPGISQEEELDSLTDRISDKIIRKAGSPSSLQIAANNLSIDFLRWKKDKFKKKPPLATAMEKALSAVKLY